MAPALVAARLWRASTPEAAEADLAALWREAAARLPVSRAVMTNLVVFSRCRSGSRVDLGTAPRHLPVDEVARLHPSRVLVLHHDPEAADAHAPAAVRVEVLVFDGGERRYGVEQIAIQTDCSDAALHSIVRRLLLGDVPTSIWWTADVALLRPQRALTSVARQIVYDSRDWRAVDASIRALAPLVTGGSSPDLADVNWTRLTPVRRALLHALATCDAGARLHGARISHRPGDAALAWLFAGWLAAGELRPGIGLSLGGAGGSAAVQVDPDAAPGGDAMVCAFDDGLTVRLGDREVRVDDPHGPAPFSMRVPARDEADAVASELRALAPDRCLRGVLATLARHFHREG